MVTGEPLQNSSPKNTVPKEDKRTAERESERSIKQLSVEAAVAELMLKEYPMRAAKIMAANHMLSDVSGTYRKLEELGHK